MKYSIGILTTITLITAFVFSSCDTRSKKSDNPNTTVIEAERNAEMAKNEVEAELRIYRANNAERIKDYNRKISEIKRKIENESNDEVKEELEEKLEEVEESHRDLKREMDNYKVSGKENWENFKDSFSSKMDDLGDSIDDFFSSTSTTSSNN